mgnify:FL=1
MIYLDANFIIASVVNDVEKIGLVERFLRVTPGPFYVSPLADYEARKHLCAVEDNEWEARLDFLLKNKFTALAGGWESPILQALKIARQFKGRLGVDSADTLHVGWALSVGAETFASFDRASGPRVRALALGLKLFPKENPKDFAEMKKLK